MQRCGSGCVLNEMRCIQRYCDAATFDEIVDLSHHHSTASLHHIEKLHEVGVSFTRDCFTRRQCHHDNLKMLGIGFEHPAITWIPLHKAPKSALIKDTL